LKWEIEETVRFLCFRAIENSITYMKFQYSSIEVMARWIMQFGDQATVVAPESLKNRIKTLATQLYNHYQD